MRYTARYILQGTEFAENLALEVENDRIVAVGPRREGDTDLGQCAIVPGLVNAHSHAFQRAIRGRTEWIDPDRPEDDFWSWRERMYGAALTYSPEDIHDVAQWAFLEMALSGITTVGEFHYVHHQPDGRSYEDPNELAQRVIAAARAVGLRIVLLRVAYQRAGHDSPASTRQRRFVDASVEGYLERADALRSAVAKWDNVLVGIAPHSIRAVDRTWLTELGEAARAWDVPLHIHACEQRREIQESVAEYGKPPLEVFEDLGILDERLTLVHATHLTDDELELAAERRPTVCACPTTERNLGDGFLPAYDLLRRSVPVCLGSDSHTNIDLWEDARLVEYHERLRMERRNVLATTTDDGRTASALLPMLAESGARSLRVNAGVLEAGRLADFVTLDLNHPTLVGADRESLAADVCLSMTPDAVKDVYVAGRRIVENRNHPLLDEARESFRAVANR